MPVDWAAGTSVALDALPRLIDLLLRLKAPWGTEEYDAAFRAIQAEVVDNVAASDLAALSRGELVAHTGVLLRMLVAIVKGSMGSQETVVNACYMVPMEPDAAVELAFHEDNWKLDSYHCFLKLEAWAEETPDLPMHLVLPVPKATQDRLFGAPRAFASNTLQVVNNTRRCHWLVDKHRCPETRHRVEQYFRQYGDKIRSFASIPIEPPFPERSNNCRFHSPSVGIVNIHSSRKYVLGRARRNRRRWRSVLSLPLLLLSYYVGRLHPEPVPLPK